MGFKSKSNVTDVLFSDLVRDKCQWQCARCGREHERKQNTMDTSHYWGRGNRGVRFDFENADGLCRYPCHQGKDSTNPRNFGWEYQKQIKGYNGAEADGAYTAYKKKQLGEDRFNALMLRAHKPTKVDEKSLRMAFKMELAKIKDCRNGVKF